MRNNHLEVISALLEHNKHTIAISNERNNLGKTAFHEAVERGKVECVKHFLHYGIDRNVKTNNFFQETPLHIAVRNSHLNVLSVLLEDSLIKDNPNAHGKTALHLAAEKGKVDFVKALLSNEMIDRNPTSALQETPLQLADRHNHPKVVAVLFQDPLTKVDCSMHCKYILNLILRLILISLIGLCYSILLAGIYFIDIFLLILCCKKMTDFPQDDFTFPLIVMSVIFIFLCHLLILLCVIGLNPNCEHSHSPGEGIKWVFQGIVCNDTNAVNDTLT